MAKSLRPADGLAAAGTALTGRCRVLTRWKRDHRVTTLCRRYPNSFVERINLDGTWEIDPQPALPPEQQIENSALYYEPSNETWFLFTNHIGLDDKGEYTESVWAYWNQDLNHWNPERRAVVLDRTNCKWSKRCIGMPSVVTAGRRLALFYDSSATHSGDMGRDVGLAWLSLPLQPPE